MTGNGRRALSRRLGALLFALTLITAAPAAGTPASPPQAAHPQTQPAAPAPPTALAFQPIAQRAEFTIRNAVELDQQLRLFQIVNGPH